MPGLNFNPSSLANNVQNILNSANRHIPCETYLDLNTPFDNGQVVVVPQAHTVNNPHVPYAGQEFAGRYQFLPAHFWKYPQIHSVPLGTSLAGITLHNEDGSIAFVGNIAVKTAEDVFEGATFEDDGHKQYPVLVCEDTRGGDGYLFYVPNSVAISGWGGLDDPTYISMWWMFSGETAGQAGSDVMEGMAQINCAALTSPLSDTDEIELFRAAFSKVPPETKYVAGIYQLQKSGPGPEYVKWNLLQPIGASGSEGRLDALEDALNRLFEATKSQQ